MYVLAFLLFLLQSPAQDAVTAYEQGRLEDAERSARAAVAATPNDPRAIGLLAVILDSAKKYEEAERQYTRALKLAPNSPALLNNLGNHYLAREKAKEARAAFERVIKLQPGHPNAHLQLAKLAAEAGDAAAVERHLQRLPPEQLGNPAVTAIRAAALASSGKVEDAVKLAGADVRVLFAAAMTLARAEKYGEAERVFSAALELAPGEFDILYNLGLAALKAGRNDRAMQVLQAARRQKPDDVDTLFTLARAYAAAEQVGAAAAVLADARRLSPQRTDILQALAEALNRSGYHVDAAEAWTEFLKIKPDADFARRERGFALMHAGKKEEGLPDLEWYAARHPKDFIGQFHLALAYTVDAPAKALEGLNRALVLDPENPEALYARGALLHDEGKAADALPDLERAIKAQPDNPQILDRLGQVYRVLGRAADSERVLRKAVTLAPNDGTIHMHLGMTLRDAGKREEAMAHLEKFRKLGSSAGRTQLRSGLLEFLNLSPAEQMERHLANVRKGIELAPDKPEMYIRLGITLLDLGRQEEADKAFADALSRGATPPMLASAGNALLRHERWPQAVELLQRAAVPGSALQTRLNLSIARFHADGPEAGLKALESIAESDRQGDYWLARAQMLDAAGKFQDAVDALNRGFRAAPTRADLYSEASLFLIKYDRLKEASELLEQATATLREAAELHLLRAIVYELSDNTEAAQKTLVEIERRWPEWDRAWLIHGIILASRLQPAEARRLLENAIALGSQDAEAYFYLADAITKSTPDDTASAHAAIQKALELGPEDPYAHSLAGQIELSRGNAQAAIRHLAKAVELLPSLSQAHTYLSRAYAQIGDKDKAAEEAQIVRKLVAEQRAADPEPAAKKTLFRVRVPR